MSQDRRREDDVRVQAVGWAACLFLAISLGYAFLGSLVNGPEELDPYFFSGQAVASLLFLIYSVQLRNRVFIVANVIALLNAVGTVVVILVG